MRGKLSRQAWVWLILLAATFANWELMEVGLSGGPAVRYLGAAVLVIAFVKSWLVIDNFMEVRDAPAALRGGMAGWTVVVCGTLLAQAFLF